MTQPSNKATESPNPKGLAREDKIRIDDHAMAYSYLGVNYKAEKLYDNKAHAGFKEGAEYATLYEREQLRAEVEYLKNKLNELQKQERGN